MSLMFITFSYDERLQANLLLVLPPRSDERTMVKAGEIVKAMLIGQL